MKKYSILPLVLIASLAMFLTGCNEPVPVDGGDLVEQSAVLNIVTDDGSSAADPYRPSTKTLTDPEINTYQLRFSVSLYKLAEMDYSVKLNLDMDEAEKMAKVSGRDYRLLPTSMIQLPENAVIKKGDLASEEMSLTVTTNEELEGNVPYFFAVRLAPISGVQLIEPNNVAVFAVTRYEESNEINISVRMTRDKYFKLENPFTYRSGDLTMEGLIYVEKFRDAVDVGEAQISTLMGIEGGTLLRFGDSGLDGNKLQAAGTPLDFVFETNRWYHFAMVTEGGNTTVYINGDKQLTFRKTTSLVGGNEFFIGRSWSDGRGIQARMAEFRIWTKARTQAEIQDNIYLVDPKSEGLLAYWKMNTAEGNKVMDATGNGHNILQFGQAGLSGEQPVTVFNEDIPISID